MATAAHGMARTHGCCSCSRTSSLASSVESVDRAAMRLFTTPTAPSNPGAELGCAQCRAAAPRRCSSTVESTASVLPKRSVAPHVDAVATSVPRALCTTISLLCRCDPSPLCSVRSVCVAHVWRGLWRLLGRAWAAPRCAIAMVPAGSNARVRPVWTPQNEPSETETRNERSFCRAKRSFFDEATRQA